MNNHGDCLANVTKDYIIERSLQNGDCKLSFKILENIDDDQGSFHFLLEIENQGTLRVGAMLAF